MFVINSELVMQVRRQHPCAIGHFRVPKTLTFKMRLGTQPFLWKWVLFAWEWKMISLSKAEHLPSFWNRGPGELGNGLLALFAPHCRNYYSWVSSTTNDTFGVLLPEASLPGLVQSVVHGKHVRPYAGKPSETEWIRTWVRCHHYN